eukprot:TCONS_00049714-protein
MANSVRCQPCDIRRWSGCKDITGTKTKIDDSTKNTLLREYLRKQIRQIFGNNNKPSPSPKPDVITNNEIPMASQDVSSILSKKLAAIARARITIQKEDLR